MGAASIRVLLTKTRPSGSGLDETGFHWTVAAQPVHPPAFITDVLLIRPGCSSPNRAKKVIWMKGMFFARLAAATAAYSVGAMPAIRSASSSA